MIDSSLNDSGKLSAMTAPLSNVEYAPASSSPFQAVVTSALEFEATITRLKQAIAAMDLWLISEVDPQMFLERGGYAIQPARQLFFFHPRYAVRILGSDPSAFVEIPLKLVVLQMPDGSVTVRCNDVEGLLSRYKDLAGLAAELAEISRNLMMTVCQPT
jgi:uncharacterized protein (DUF302 family)